jgi:hypothetical protein
LIVPCHRADAKNQEQLFPELRTEPKIAVSINPFVTGYVNGAMEQLEGQIASAWITITIQI